jgi:hypothetical protein
VLIELPAEVILQKELPKRIGHQLAICYVGLVLPLHEAQAEGEHPEQKQVQEGDEVEHEQQQHAHGGRQGPPDVHVGPAVQQLRQAGLFGHEAVVQTHHRVVR